MKDFEHLMSVWQGQPKPEQLSVDEALKQAKRGLSDLSSKLRMNILGMMITFVCLFLIMLFSVFQSWLTYTGIALIMITVIIYASMMIRDYKLIKNRDITIHPAHYLQSLKEYQKSRAKVYGWMLYVYVILLSIGLALNFFEVLMHRSVQFKLAVYSLTIGWLLFCTFYLKGRIFKNEQEKLALIIDRLERLQDQFN